jgi:hypothetical protein
MYEGAGGSQDDLQLLGIPAAVAGSFSAEATAVEVWPENWAALELFSAISTQWRVGMGGATGLDYTALPVVMDMQDTAPEHRRERFDEIRVMERAALDVMAEKAKAKS